MSYSSVGDFRAIARQTKVQMTDLNKELGIEVKIPDTLKREVGQRRGFSGGGRRYGGGNRYGGGGRRYGGRSEHGERHEHRERHSSGKQYYGLRSRW